MKLINFVKFLLSQHFSDILFLNYLMNCSSDPKEDMMRSLRWMQINCFNRFRFLSKVSTNLQKMCNFRQFKDHNSGKNKGNQRNDPIFWFTFWALSVCDIHFCIWKISKFVFMGSPLWSILVCKIPEFEGESCEIRILSRLIQET